jgi:hypothetical protein
MAENSRNGLPAAVSHQLSALSFAAKVKVNQRFSPWLRADR